MGAPYDREGHLNCGHRWRMRLLKEIICQNGLCLEGKTYYREAVRGIIHRDGKLLMIYSDKVGDYKFPGGGVKDGEAYDQALIREVAEESGATISSIDDEFGMVIEYDTPMEETYDLFKMASYYYCCQIRPAFGVQHLDDYEEELGFRPVWVDVDTALQANQELLLAGNADLPRWTLRETYLLGEIKKQLQNIS